MTPAPEVLDQARGGAAGTVLILSANPIHDTGGGQRSAQLALEFLHRGWAVVFVSHGVVTETVDLGLRYDQPRLIRWTIAEAVEARSTLLDALAGDGGLVVTQVPVAEWAPLVREAAGRGVPTVYDCIDRWDSELGRGWYRRGVETDIARASTALVASAPVLVDHVEELAGRRVELLPNAYNGRVFSAGVRHQVARPEALPAGRRVALYVGALWGGWMDWALAGAAAEALPDTTFVFVGDHRGEGRALPDNCVFTGLMPQTDLPPFLAHADVAFLPWRVDEVTVATSPLKVYEFVAMGLPVVAPDIEPLRGIPGVRTEGGGDAFVRALGRVDRAGLGEEERSAMRGFAENNSWARRVDDLLRIAGGSRAFEGGVEDAGAGRRRACVSVVVPAFNHERFVGRALDSVEEQTLPPGEVVVVDDGSSDGTAEVVARRARAGVRLVRQENRGAHNALNRAIRLARGEWVAVLNSDDAWEPERLEQAWAVARQAGAALVVGAVRLVDDQEGDVDPEHEIARWYREAVSWAAEAGSLSAVLARHNIGVTTSNFFFHRSLWSRLGGFRAYRYVHDYDFILRATELMPAGVVYAPELEGVLYRVHAANTITDGGAAQRERKDLMASLARPAGRLRRTVSAWRTRRALAAEVESSSVLEPLPGMARVSRSRPRVGLIVDSLGLGGLEEVVALLAQSLPSVGVDAVVACVRSGGAVARRLTEVGVDVTHFHGRIGGVAGWVSERGIVAANSHFAPVDAVQALVDAGVPVVETVQNCYAWLDDEGWGLERRRAEAAAGVIAVSETVAAYYEARTGRSADWTIPNAVHPARAAASPRAFARAALGLDPDVPVLAFVGRITEQKNPAGLLEAFALAVEEIPDAVLVLAGPADGSASMRALRRRHAELFRRGAVRHLTEVRHVGSVLSAADGYVSNAFHEGWSVAASEAAWVGRPLALSETGGSRELVGVAVGGGAGHGVEAGAGHRGYLAPNPCGDPLSVDVPGMRGGDEALRRGNEESMGAAMVRLVRDTAAWRSRAPEIRAWARDALAPEVIADRYARALLGVADRGAGR